MAKIETGPMFEDSGTLLFTSTVASYELIIDVYNGPADQCQGSSIRAWLDNAWTCTLLFLSTGWQSNPVSFIPSSRYIQAVYPQSSAADVGNLMFSGETVTVRFFENPSKLQFCKLAS